MRRADFLGALGALAAGVVIGCGEDETDTPAAGGSAPTGSGGGGNGGGSTTTSTAATTSSSTGGTGPGSGGSGGGGACSTNIDAQITCRHGHELIVTAADLLAGEPKSYNIQGTASHSHMLTVTAQMFEQLQQGMTVEIFVPSQIQPHTVYIKCTGLDPNALDDQGCN
jgi:hypothetical protein